MPSKDEEPRFLRSLIDTVWARNQVGQQPDGYRVYTRDFDLTLTVNGLIARYGAMSPLDEQEFARNQALRDSGVYHADWPAHRAAVEAALREGLDQASRERTVVCLLVDLSGSMRDSKILQVALAVDAMQQILTDLDIDLEVLGFSTVLWKGGDSRSRWIQRGQPAWPGRLNDLLHIIYVDADTPVTANAPPTMVHMLRPDLLKENIDGEALEWAALRLRRRPDHRRLLVVISDGAPVDDSTLVENGPDYLERHLRGVVRALEQGGEVELGALGVGHSVDRYYRRSMSTEDPRLTSTVLATLIRRMLVEPNIWQAEDDARRPEA